MRSNGIVHAGFFVYYLLKNPSVSLCVPSHAALSMPMSLAFSTLQDERMFVGGGSGILHDTVEWLSALLCEE